MSEVKRFYMGEPQSAFGAFDTFVRSEDYDAAQSELAALREELVQAKRDRDCEQRAAIEANKELKAAEQRNAELSEQLADEQECYRSIAMRSDIAASILNSQEAELKKAIVLLRDSYAELLDIKAAIGFRGATIALIGRIDAYLSTAFHAALNSKPECASDTKPTESGASE